MKLYNDYNSYLKQKYGCRVYKIGLDAGFSCPNRDGTKGTDGCLYCNEDASRASYTQKGSALSEQIKKRIYYLKGLGKPCKFIAYFQAFTNTYASPDKLKEAYDAVLGFDDIVGISIGTRPDAVDRDKLRLINSYRDRYDVWLEYGLQSMRDETLRTLKRGHTFADFADAVELAREFDIPVSAHVILGLPGETGIDAIETARALSGLGVKGVKIHLLHVLKGSRLERLYNDGEVSLLSQDGYVNMVCDFLENLSSDILIHRLTGEGPRDKHIAPDWAMNKIDTINKIKDTLKSRGSHQGMNF